MSQNLQIASEPEPQADTITSTEGVQDARSLIDHLNSALQVEESTKVSAAEVALPAAEDSVREAPSFAKAIMKQTDQIQYLVDQINRLDTDNELAKLRGVVVDLCGALSAVTLRMKQDTSRAAGKISLLMEALTIIGGAPDNVGSSHDIASILAIAEAASERLMSLERLSNETSGAIAGLEETGSRGQKKIRDLSAGLIKLNESVESGREEIARLHQRIGSADHDSAQGLATLGAHIEAERSEIAGLRQRIGSADQALEQGMAQLDERASAIRGDLARVGERLASIEDSAVLQAALGEKIEIIGRRLGALEQDSATEIRNLRLQESERNAALASKLESLEQENQSLAQGTEQMAARLNSAEQTIATVVQRQKALSAVHDRVVRLLVASTDLEG
jgi:chromosome segregation ATPase